LLPKLLLLSYFQYAEAICLLSLVFLEASARKIMKRYASALLKGILLVYLHFINEQKLTICSEIMRGCGLAHIAESA
jgi:hypothetical protein